MRALYREQSYSEFIFWAMELGGASFFHFQHGKGKQIRSVQPLADSEGLEISITSCRANL